jgi:uncharacterized heparinase superfamily protein
MRAVMMGWGPGDAAGRIARAEAVLAGRFTFLAHEEHLEVPDWNARPASPLWTYNLHYFEYARDLAWARLLTGEQRFADRFAELAESWIADTSGGRGPGWEPYPMSVRLSFWLEALLLLGDALEAGVAERIRTSAYVQLCALEQRIEWHLLANHVQKNLHAILLGGLAFEDERAGRWRRDYGALLWRELFEQVLPDGAHFERSPSYHALALVDFLEALQLVEATGGRAPENVRPMLERMVAAYGCLSRDDGTPLLLNDSAIDAAPAPEAIRVRAQQTLGTQPSAPEGVWALRDAGYFGVRDAGAPSTLNARASSLVVDCGPIGPDYQPAHGHCDALSFLLDIGDIPIVVDSGLSGYDGNGLRAYERSTRAHNTVSVDGLDQSELWGTFRVARRVRAHGASIAREGDRTVFRGSATPFHDARRTHHRVISLGADSLEVTDTVDGNEVRAQSFLHLHPSVLVTLIDGVARARVGALEMDIEPLNCEGMTCESGVLDPAQGWYAERFGQAVPAPVLTMQARGGGGRSFGYILRWRSLPV